MTFLNVRAPSGHLRCANLRCKEMYYHSDLDAEKMKPVVSDDDDKHAYWCVKTARRYGTDQQLATLDGCSPSRSCYQP
jgi:hypothetical protein